MGVTHRVEDELNAIRIRLYEQTKGMTPEEEVAYLKKLSAPVLKEFGIQPLERRETDELRL
jgi:hypothetical protein